MVLSIATPGFVNKFLSISSSNKENLLSWAVKYSMLLDRESWPPTKFQIRIGNVHRVDPQIAKAHALRFGGCFADVVTGVRFFTVLWNLLIGIIFFLCRLWYFPVYKFDREGLSKLTCHGIEPRSAIPKSRLLTSSHLGISSIFTYILTSLLDIPFALPPE
jgi:hypothetical protein